MLRSLSKVMHSLFSKLKSLLGALMSLQHPKKPLNLAKELSFQNNKPSQ